MNRQHVLRITKADCKLDTFRAGGNGGQKQNSTDSGVRWTHIASGAVGEARDGRSQWQNKQKAWKRMAEHPKFRRWVNSIVFDWDKAIEEKVERWMKEENLEIETYEPI